MKRHILSAAISLACAMVAPSVSAANLDVASTFPKDMLFLGDALKQFAKNVEKVSSLWYNKISYILRRIFLCLKVNIQNY